MEVIGHFQIFVFILGVLGKRMLNPEVLKCHEDLNTLDTYAQHIFGHMRARGGGGASIIRLGPSWFTYTLYLIIIYISNLEAI